MNKLIKSAMMMASVGAMLCIVGCGEELTPAERADKQIAEFFSLVTDCGGVIPQSIKDELAQAPEAGKIDRAEKIAKEIAALTGGKGGGKPDGAMAGAGDIAKIDEALAQFENVAAEIIK